MSAVQTTKHERYIMYYSRPLKRWIVSDTDTDYRSAPYKLADSFRSQCAAEYATRMLNNGLATINPHAVIGCRVEVE